MDERAVIAVDVYTLNTESINISAARIKIILNPGEHDLALFDGDLRNEFMLNRTVSS